MRDILCIVLFKLIIYVLIVITIDLKPPNSRSVAYVNAQSDFYLNSVELVSPAFYMLYWNYTGSNITAEVVVNTYGWVSFGILKDSSLEGSDLMLAWVSGSRTVFVDCYYSGSDVFPDPKQNWQLIDSFESNGYTTIKFTRSVILSKVDKDHDIDIESGTPVVSYSWGTADPFKFINYNSTNLGFMPVPLLNTVNLNPNATASETVYTLTYSVPSISLPSDQTEYFYCMPVSLPVNTSTQNFHLTQFITSLQSGNEDYVYDWKLYFCPGFAYLDQLPAAGSCHPNSGNGTDSLWRSTLLSACSVLGLMWTKGNFLTQKFPQDAGYPFGYNTNFSIFDTFIIRFHYVNPNLDINVTDTTSIKFVYTPNVRTYSIGSLTIGGYSSWQGISIPPGTNSLSTTFDCFATCVNSLGTDSPGINIFASYMNTYSYGQSIVSKLIRNGGEYMYIGRNKFYNNEYQYLLYLDSIINLIPGDQITTTCVYDTSSTSSWIFGGSTEMCLNLLYYYPASAYFTTCTSAPVLEDWNSFISNLKSIHYLTSSGNTTSSNDVAVTTISAITPTNTFLKRKFQEFYYYSRQEQQCNINATLAASSQIVPLFFLTDDSVSLAARKCLLIMMLLVTWLFH